MQLILSEKFGIFFLFLNFIGFNNVDWLGVNELSYIPISKLVYEMVVMLGVLVNYSVMTY
jgi:hypothetical protein